MTTATATKPTLREILLDALNDAYYSRRANVEECRFCAKQPAGVGPCHQEDSDLCRDYEDARKQIERSPGNPEVLAVLGDDDELAALLGTEGSGES
jgi:hypothetical protein